MSFAPFFFSSRRAPRLLAAAAALVVASCGGGGGGGGSEVVTVTPSSLLAPSASLAGVCHVAGEQAFARSHLDEVYLWRERIAPVPAQDHATVQSYFDALVLRAPDATGQPTDRFSAVLTADEADSLLTANAAPSANLLTTSGYAVPLASTVSTPAARTVGYLLFNKHGRGAQDALIAAFEALRDARIQDLVLDLRHNPGGYLYIAQAVASMIAGPQQNGQVFEHLRYNERRTSQGAGSSFHFTGTVQRAETLYPVGHPLPQLALPRVYVLASGITCSASESIVNGLRGVGIEVVLVGDTTCGKPYGFKRKDNCGKAYFAIEFQGVNAAGFGDYAGGFAPQCAVAEDPHAALGDTREPLLAAALHHIDNGVCPVQPKSLAGTRRSGMPASALVGRLLAPPH